VSTKPFPGPYPTTIAHILVHHITTTPPTPRHAKSAGQVLRRRPTAQQGRSLELLGHAIEYLVDSQLCLNHAAHPNDQAEAAQILMRLSREVFAECREVAPTPESILRLLRLFAAGRTA
jgi:hypothetical protein